MTRDQLEIRAEALLMDLRAEMSPEHAINLLAAVMSNVIMCSSPDKKTALLGVTVVAKHMLHDVDARYDEFSEDYEPAETRQ